MMLEMGISGSLFYIIHKYLYSNKLWETVESMNFTVCILCEQARTG